MTKAQAFLYLDFVGFRLFGWNTVERMKHHHSSHARKAVDAFWRRSISDGPRPEQFVAAAMAGEPVHLLWPEEMQAEVERQMDTKVPRAINEPTNADFIKSMHEGGRTDWVLPDFLANHGRDA
jgi:hypothetical protein